MSIVVHINTTFEHQSDIDDYVNENGLSVSYLHPDSRSVHVQGPQEELNRFVAFLKTYESQGVHVIVPNNRSPVAKSHIRSVRPCDHSAPASDIKSHANPVYFTAKELANVYQIAGNPKSRTNVAIIELGGGFNNSDLQAYWTHLGLTTKPVVTAVAVDGVGNSPGNDADAEVVLDIEVVGGICPNSNIYVYFAPNTNQGFYDAIHAAVYNTKAPTNIISISWGGPENTWDTATMNSFNSLFEAATLKGITVCVASGDSGATDGETGNHADFPASSPFVLACGGSRLTCPNRVYSSSTTKEVAWGTVVEDGSGSGGGFSTVFTRPSYQDATVSKYKKTGRGVPDVCGNADPQTGWVVYLNGQYQVIGGTSAVAPMWAGFLASIGYNKFLNPVLYSLYQLHASIVHDITVGNNGSFNAVKQWDPVTGLGSPSGSVLAPLL
jgi:kumamolisin